MENTIDNKSTTLEQLLRMTTVSENLKREPVNVSPEFIVSVQEMTDTAVRIIIHPNCDGKTLDFWVRNNELMSLEDYQAALLTEERKQDHLCTLCGNPMPEGEEMFFFYGYSGNCPDAVKK